MSGARGLFRRRCRVAQPRSTAAVDGDSRCLCEVCRLVELTGNPKLQHIVRHTRTITQQRPKTYDTREFDRAIADSPTLRRADVANGCQGHRPRHDAWLAVAAALRPAVTAATLLYGQNWEDSAIEVAALKVGPDDRVIAVGGAGYGIQPACTTTSAAVRGRPKYSAVASLRLKLAAVCRLRPGEATAFLGGTEDHGGSQHSRCLHRILTPIPPDFGTITWRRSNTASSRKGESSAISR